MDAACGILLEELRDRRIGARGLHQLDARVRQLDVGHAHALLLVHLDLPDVEPVDLFQALGGGFEARHRQRHVRQPCNHGRIPFEIAAEAQRRKV